MKNQQINKRKKDEIQVFIKLIKSITKQIKRNKK